MLKRTWMRLAAALLAAIANFVTVPNAALAAAPLHHDQAPGFYRLKVGDLEVTALFDGPGVFDVNWLNGEKTKDGVLKALHDDPHLLDVADAGYLVNTGKQLILVDAGSGTWFGGGKFGHLVSNLRSAGYTPEEVDLVLVTHLHSDHIGGLTTQDGKIVFAAPYIKAGKWHTFSDSRQIVDGMQIVPLRGHTPGHTGYELSSQGKNILFWGDVMHVQRLQLPDPKVTVVFDVDPTAAAVTRDQLLRKLASEDVLIVGPHLLFPGLGRLHKEGGGYRWAPVAFTDQWEEK